MDIPDDDSYNEFEDDDDDDSDDFDPNEDDEDEEDLADLEVCKTIRQFCRLLSCAASAFASLCFCKALAFPE